MVFSELGFNQIAEEPIWLTLSGLFPALCLLRLAFVRCSCTYYYIIMLQDDRQDPGYYVRRCCLAVV